MAKHSPNDLNFGHFGQATYDVENSAWAFGREPGVRRELQQLGGWRMALPPSIHFERTSTFEHPWTIRHVQQEAKALARSNPEIAPSLGNLPELAVASSAVTSVTSTYDAAIGEVLSFGSFTSEGYSKNPRQVAAVVTGEVGNILRLTTLAKERHGWEQDRSIWVEGWAITDEESGYWAGDAAPIQQVCFAQSEERSAFLAARFPTRIVLFRPIYHERPVRPPRSPYYQLPPSMIEANPILSLDMETMGGTPLADVTFNPDYQRQVGFVDQEGNWSVWDIEGGHKNRSQHTISCIDRGCVLPNKHMDDVEEKGNPDREDGWARILWIGDVNTILVCNRRRLGVFDFRGGIRQVQGLPCPEIASSSSADWILDMKRNPKNKHQVFILTSSRLYLMQIKCLNDTIEDSGSAGAIIVLSWAHFRGLEDITLRICVAPKSGEESLVIMYSRLNALVTVFRFQDLDQEPLIAYSSSDPVELRLDERLFDAIGTPRYMLNLNISSLQFGEGDNLGPRGPGLAYLSNDTHFSRLSVMLSDLSVHETLLCALQPEERNGSHDALIVDRPTWTTTTRARFGHPSSNLINHDEEFVVSDGMSTMQAPKMRKSYLSPKPIQSRKFSTSQSTATRPGSWTVDYSFLYDALNRKDLNTMAQSEDISALLDRIRRLLVEEPNIMEVTQRTILAQAESRVNVLDIDEASLHLNALFSAFENSPSLKIRHIASNQVLQISEVDGQQATISSLYDTILQNWIAPLPAAVPARTRQRIERLARHIAAEIMLASLRIRRIEPAPPSLDELALQAGPTQDSAVAMHILLSRPNKETQLSPSSSQQFLIRQSSSSSQSQSQTVLPTPEPTPMNNPLSRLNQHLQIAKPINTAVPPSVNQVLMHWRLGEDPSTYNWDATTRVVQEELQGSDEISAERRAKLQRKAERHLKKQRRETQIFRERQMAESQSTFLQSQSALVRGGRLRSSPAPMVGMGGSSQVQGLSQSQGLGGIMVQSQVEPGRFGGRPEKKRKKGKSRLTIIVLSLKRCIRHKWQPNMSGFPSLQPAFTVRVDIDPPLPVGGQCGTSLVIVPMVSGTVKSEPGFEPTLDAELHGVGYDYIHNDADGGNMRLDVRSQVKNNDGTIFAMYYKGTVGLTEGVKALLGGSADAKTTPYGDSFVSFSFETGSPKYKDLENATYVAAGHFVKEPGMKGLVVEYKVSKVVSKG
ncbi:uncharacterized protein BDR25DRAFT_256583 [Lindgomyces ingoldianus]|uniref:Uncharacterized protein n=1 Tax=Lindgomyces ingoldianus TaxID=673940 RepID=A0ACB6R625_9PLEO|nr:uncharacterized protein BDR25DRAFT_256583 [Lindgomyces ingoldianus]KAF2473752.1 hypothetical protein BDR25DRAFT_256583 [Lindgomyces ingoldianus]